jgi:hypothetical protein
MARPRINPERKMVSLPVELAQQVEDYRFRLRLKTEAEAIRRLIEAGLKAESEKPLPSVEETAEVLR